MPLYFTKGGGFCLSNHRFVGWRMIRSRTLAQLAAEIQNWLEGLQYETRVQMIGNPPDKDAVLHNGFSVKSALKWGSGDYERYWVVTPAWV